MHDIALKRESWASNHARLIGFLFVAYAILTLVADIQLPGLDDTIFSPLEISLWAVIFVSLIVTATKLVASRADKSNRKSWTMAVVTVAAIAIIQSADWFSEVEQHRENTSLAIGALSIGLAASMLWILPIANKSWLLLFLKATVALQCISLVADFVITDKLFPILGKMPAVELSTELLELLCVEAYLVILAFSDHGAAEIHSFASGDHVGANARRLYHDLKLFRTPRYPPVKIAFYPVFLETTVFLAAVWLGLTSGPAVAKAIGKRVITQIWEMLNLWFRQGIDPPSYYALEMYRSRNALQANHFLTPFETKNGLSMSLSEQRVWPTNGVGLGNKERFAKYCKDNAIPCPQTLLSVQDGHEIWNCSREQLNQDLFCKKGIGAGALDTLSFRNVGDQLFRGNDGELLTLDTVLDILRRAPKGVCYLVQPWLRNHPSISDFATDSLIAFRVVTCLNDKGIPEVTLAMLRVLAKLEPTWLSVPDEEYAAPIDLETGRLGLLTGDHMRTSLSRYEKHLVTGGQVEGRLLLEWPQLRELALKVHKLFPQCVIVGWDIALTDKGPVVLEGNPNLDFMFLQRVHDKPAGKTLMGKLLNHHMERLEMLRRDKVM